MPLLLIVVLAILIAQIGFWDTIGAVLGAVAALVLFLVLMAAALAIAAYILLRRIRRRS
jgi:hypothetical protein